MPPSPQGEGLFKRKTVLRTISGRQNNTVVPPEFPANAGHSAPVTGGPVQDYLLHPARSEATFRFFLPGLAPTARSLDPVEKRTPLPLRV